MVDGGRCTSTQPPAWVVCCRSRSSCSRFHARTHAERAPRPLRAAPTRTSAMRAQSKCAAARVACGASRAEPPRAVRVLVAVVVQVMEKDIPRTFVELGMFAKGGPLEEPLRDILEAYGP